MIERLDCSRTTSKRLDYYRNINAPKRLPVTIATAAINYPIFLRRLPPRQFSLLIMSRGRESSSFSFSSFARDLPSLAGGREHGDMGGNCGGSKGCGCGAPTGTSDRIDTLGRLLVRILRHNATKLNLDMHSDGYVKLQDILKLNMKTRSNIPLSSHSIDEIREAVRIDNKQRLSLLEEDGELWIRANQGHTINSVESESLLKPILSAEEIPACVHCTYKRLLHSILASGLKRMSRLHIHFACGLPSDAEVKSGFRRDVNMIIFLDTKKAMEDGIKFYKSDNGVILTEGLDGLVPAKNFQKIESWPKRNPVSFQV